jgi:hypothetical protein
MHVLKVIYLLRRWQFNVIVEYCHLATSMCTNSCTKHLDSPSPGEGQKKNILYAPSLWENFSKQTTDRMPWRIVLRTFFSPYVYKYLLNWKTLGFTGTNKHWDVTSVYAASQSHSKRTLTLFLSLSLSLSLRWYISFCMMMYIVKSGLGTTEDKTLCFRNWVNKRKQLLTESSPGRQPKANLFCIQRQAGVGSIGKRQRRKPYQSTTSIKTKNKYSRC